MPAELFDGHQVLHGGDPQLRDQFAWRQQGAQRDQHRADSGQGHRDLHPARTVGHDQPDPGALGHARLDEISGDGVRRRVEFDVADPGRRVDDHRLGPVLGGAEPDQLIDG